MKQVAILLLMALMLEWLQQHADLQSDDERIWQAQMLGGVGPASGFSFNTQFTVNSDATLNVSSFQFLTENSNGSPPVSPLMEE